VVKFIESKDVPGLIKDGDTIYSTGMMLAGLAEEAFMHIERAFLDGGHPRDLSWYFPAGQGNFKDKGMARLAHEGLVKRIVAAHYGVGGPKLSALVRENKVEAYNWPQGVLSVMPRQVAGRRGGLFTKVGLGTFVDPRVEGSKLNARAADDLVEVRELDGEEYLYFKPPKVNVGLIRGTVADERGNITLDKEGVLLEAINIAQAARACGGIVIAQVESIAQAGTLHPKQIKVPGILVDYIYVAQPEYQRQSENAYFNPALTGDLKIPLHGLEPLPLDERKIIARRAATHLTSGSVLNLGIGMAEGVASVAAEEGVANQLTLTLETGPVGGLPASGHEFGHSINPEVIVEHSLQFDFYDGGGIDMAFLGLAQADRHGNVNVSKFGGRAVGCGGFINITQNAKRVAFLGTFTAGGLEVAVEDGKLKIIKEGKNRKLIDHVEQITFSGQYANRIRQPVLYITERAVFRLREDGLELIEVAPGIDIERDILAHMDFVPKMDNVRQMDPALFQANWGGLKALIDKHAAA
jgi:propionate CoA-transferase